MEGTIHIKNKQEQDYWIDGALVDKVTTSAYDFNRYGREAYVHYKSGEVEEIPCLVVVEVLGTYMMEPKPIPTSDEKSALEKARKDNDAQRDKNGMVKFNLNNEILVEITDKGWERLTEKNIEQYIDHCIKPHEVKIDGKTYYKLQANQLGELFEPADWVTAIGPVKPIVMLYQSDLEDAKEGLLMTDAHIRRLENLIKLVEDEWGEYDDNLCEELLEYVKQSKQ